MRESSSGDDIRVRPQFTFLLVEANKLEQLERMSGHLEIQTKT